MSRTMRAMVYRAENAIGVEDRPVATILAPTDAIIRMTKTTICGTDLGIWKGKNPEIAEVATQKTGQFNGRAVDRHPIDQIAFRKNADDLSVIDHRHTADSPFGQQLHRQLLPNYYHGHRR